MFGTFVVIVLGFQPQIMRKLQQEGIHVHRGEIYAMNVGVRLNATSAYHCYNTGLLLSLIIYRVNQLGTSATIRMAV